MTSEDEIQCQVDEVTQQASTSQPEKDDQLCGKKRKRVCKWQDGWTRYNMKKSRRGYCIVCSSEFSVASGGVSDLKKHLLTKKHSELSSIHRYFSAKNRCYITKTYALPD